MSILNVPGKKDFETFYILLCLAVFNPLPHMLSFNSPESIVKEGHTEVGAEVREVARRL